MVIKSNEEKTLWIDKSNMNGINVVNNTIDNEIDVNIDENGLLKANSLCDKEFSYEIVQGGFPIRLHKLILT